MALPDFNLLAQMIQAGMLSQQGQPQMMQGQVPQINLVEPPAQPSGDQAMFDFLNKAMRPQDGQIRPQGTVKSRVTRGSGGSLQDPYAPQGLDWIEQNGPQRDSVKARTDALNNEISAGRQRASNNMFDFLNQGGGQPQQDPNRVENGVAYRNGMPVGATGSVPGLPKSTGGLGQGFDSGTANSFFQQRAANNAFASMAPFTGPPQGPSLADAKAPAMGNSVLPTPPAGTTLNPGVGAAPFQGGVPSMFDFAPPQAPMSQPPAAVAQTVAPSPQVQPQVQEPMGPPSPFDSLGMAALKSPENYNNPQAPLGFSPTVKRFNGEPAPYRVPAQQGLWDSIWKGGEMPWWSDPNYRNAFSWMLAPSAPQR